MSVTVKVSLNDGYLEPCRCCSWRAAIAHRTQNTRMMFTLFHAQTPSGTALPVTFDATLTVQALKDSILVRSMFLCEPG